jgi:hypothetical protein
VREDDSVIYIGNDFIEVGFRKETGALWSIVHKSSGIDLRGLKSDAGESLWDLQLFTASLEHIGPSGIRRSRSYYKGYSINQSASEVETTFEWDKIWLENYGEYPARVLASVKVSENSKSANFSLKIENSGAAAIEEVCYPFIWEVSKLGTDASDDVLVVPDENGRLFHNPSENLNWWGQAYPSGFCTMQFMAYYDKHAGFFFSTYDENANTKFFSWSKSDDLGVWIGISHYPTINFSSSFTLDYDIVVEVFDGDWYSAADIYKNWADKQWWSSETTQPPNWLQEIVVSKDFSCYVMSCYDIHEYRNRTFEECIQMVQEHQVYFDQPSLLFLWGWEKGGAWSYGDYFPPYEGWDEFDRLVQEVHNANTRIWLPIGTLGVLADSEPWKSGTAEPNAVVDEEGSCVSTPSDGSELIYMCHFTEYWRSTLREYVLTLAGHGVDFIQFDGFPWCPPDLNVYASGRSCYNASHGHPLGYGGNWYAKTWFAILDSIEHESRTINPELVFGGEGGAEVFLPVLDVYHSRDSWSEGFDSSIQSGIASVIPLFNYVYHNSTIFVGEHNLGLYEFLDTHSYNGLGLARILTWGEVPSYNVKESLYDPSVDSALVDYVKRIGDARANFAHNFLQNSEMIKPVEIDSLTTLVQTEDGRSFNVSALQYSAWRSEDDAIGYILTNIANTSIEVTGQIDLPMVKPYVAYVVRDGKLDWTDYSANASYSFSLAINPLEIVLLAFKQDSHPWTVVCDQTGEEEHIFEIYSNVYVRGGNFTPGINITLHAVPNNVTPSRDSAVCDSWVFTDSDGNLPLTLLWKNLTVIGNYSVWIDLNQNGVYDEIDLYDNTSLAICAFQIVPEFLLVIIPVLVMAFLSLTVVLKRRKPLRKLDMH